ncbi:unnamed protein product [Didymodactylos carnosus]|uniref:Chromo domain-containing protein n=1 Tax=Didymodactylos carnosus TaxID=1234261 RepID=A0A813T3M1_9BILA|nr:unnamed protein product [Didymodactylos carnosus]CAF1259771.1 unnamed protein product [Didymodactylos carnosus]CAF3593952.1 unnamed protein product [Didymodactylos carnosus]CAF4066520.1 unnamed protein product [Didymodactylos carnosus]
MSADTAGKRNGNAKLMFEAGENVLCFHGPVLYPAKCLQTNISPKKGAEYFVHYSGWSKRWDEWVGNDRIVKFSPENIKLQQELMLAHGNSSNNKPGQGRSKKQRETHTPVVETSVPEENPVPSDDSVEKPVTYENKVEIEIKLPEQIKSYLSEDWKQINMDEKLLSLPCEINVEKILEQYRQIKVKSQKPNEFTYTNQFINSVKDYFNSTLGTQLLYAKERNQYDQICQSAEDDIMQPSNIYGIAHLLRLMSRLGIFLAYSPLEENELNYLLTFVNDFLRFLEKHIKTWFNEDNYILNPVS